MFYANCIGKKWLSFIQKNICPYMPNLANDFAKYQYILLPLSWVLLDRYY